MRGKISTVVVVAVAFATARPALAGPALLFDMANGSVLYAVHWDDGASAVAALDGRMPHVEVALL